MILLKKCFISFRSLLGPLFLAALLFCSAVTPAGAVINVSVAPGGTVDIVIDPFRPDHTANWGQFTYLGLAGPFANGTTSKVSMSGIVVDAWGTGNFNGTSPNNRIYYGSDTLRYTNNGTGLNTTVSINATWGNGMDSQADTINILITNSGASVVSINMMDPNPTVASSVRWQVQFDQAVTGVNTGNFQLTGGVTGAAVTGVSGSGSSWTVTAGTGTGTGLLGLNMVNSTGTTPQVLGLTFTGQPYSFDQAPTIVTYPANITILANQNATLTATVGSRSASGSDPIRYQWYNAAVGTMSNPVCAQGAVTTSPAAISCTVGPLSATPANGYWVDVWNNYNASSLHTVSTDGRVTVNHAPAMATNLGLLASKNNALALTTSRLQATDPEQDSSGLTYTVTAGPGHGTLNSSTFTQWDIDNGIVIYTPTSGYIGSDSFSFSLSDGQPAPGEGKLNSSAAIFVNDVPSFVGSTTTLTVNRNAGATDIKSLLHVSDTDSSQTETWTQSAAPDHGGTLTFSSATAPSGTTNITPGGTITYTPANGYSGTETFAVQVGDGTATATRTITVTVNAPPTVTDAKISISGASGTGGAYKIGDTVTATWNNTAAGDNNTDVTNVTVDFSAFGGGAAVVAANSSGTWTATYVTAAGAIDGTNKNVSITATNGAGSTTTADSSNATVDTVAPTVSDANISISGATGTGGTFKTGDIVTATWNNTAGGDNNSDTISSVTVNFSQFGGGAAVAASNSAGTWTATYSMVAGVLNSVANRNVSVTAIDNAGNVITTADTSNATIDNAAPTTTILASAFSADTGTSSTDFITKTAAQTISGTTSANMVAG
ncbi:MAG: cadherin-like domain-containing protein, partial [Pelobacteraceae bacterium]